MRSKKPRKSTKRSHSHLAKLKLSKHTTNRNASSRPKIKKESLASSPAISHFYKSKIKLERESSPPQRVTKLRISDVGYNTCMGKIRGLMRRTGSLPKITPFTKKRMSGFRHQVDMLNKAMFNDDDSEEERELHRRFDELNKASEKRKKKYSNSKIFLTLVDKHEYPLDLEEFTYLLGHIDSRKKFLPVEIDIIQDEIPFHEKSEKSSEVKTELLISFNEFPTKKKHELSFYDTHITVSILHQKYIISEKSIKFRLIAHSSFKGKIRAKFKGIRPERAVVEIPRFEEIDYSEFLDFTLLNGKGSSQGKRRRKKRRKIKKKIYSRASNKADSSQAMSYSGQKDSYGEMNNRVPSGHLGPYKMIETAGSTLDGNAFASMKKGFMSGSTTLSSGFGGYSKVELNKKDLHLFNGNYKRLIIQHHNALYDKKRIEVLKKKERIWEEAKARKIDNSNKFLKMRAENVRIAETMLILGLKLAYTTTWCKLLKFYVVINDIRERFWEEKKKRFRKKMINSKARLIGLMFKSKLISNRNKRIKKNDLMVSRQTFIMLTTQIRQRVIKQNQKTFGKFLDFMSTATMMHHAFFEYRVYFDRLKKKFKRHLQVKHQQFRIFQAGLQKAVMQYINLAELLEDDEKPKSIKYFEDHKVQRRLYHLFFNFQLIDFLKKKYEFKCELHKETLIKQKLKRGETVSYLIDRGHSLYAMSEEGSEKLFELNEVIKFEKILKTLHNHEFYPIYSKYQSYLNGKKPQRFQNFLNKKLIKSLKESKEIQKRQRKGKSRSRKSILKRTSTSGLFKKLDKQKLDKQRQIKKKIQEIEKQEQKKTREKFKSKKFKSKIFNNMELLNKSGLDKFTLEITKDSMLILVLTVIEYYEARPIQYESLVTHESEMMTMEPESQVE